MNASTFSVSVNVPVSEAVQKVQDVLAANKFGVLWHLDMHAKLREKGLDLDTEFHILEVCNPGKAKQALETNIHTGYFLPCRVVVFSEGGSTKVGMVKPTVLIDLLHDQHLGEFAAEVNQTLTAALQSLA